MSALTHIHRRPAARKDIISERRRELEDAVERALAALDALDGDPDFKPEEDLEHDGSEPDADLEPSLCGISMPISGVGRDYDLEATSPPFTMDQRELERA